ncbi:hypothetical protein JHK85_009567 [Glycine max]|uniref:Uncharacterized protein n=2 Tax=Glycine subgen. Soja TaxID=1462606 RepID=K7KIN4_SOYBN|nr:hypothetical protein JHK85_009567 [Glycine max]KAG5065582.1 hypothetical protein JHK86_009313 [Glycine max]RZC15466.1 hypothetical protein D0Y65_009028 [Glycine soja]
MYMCAVHSKLNSLFVHFCTNVSCKFTHLLVEAESAAGADSETLSISCVSEDSSHSNCKVKKITGQKV